MVAWVIQIPFSRYISHNLSASDGGAALGDGGKCAEGICPHATHGKYQSRFPLGDRMIKISPPPPG